MKITEVSPAHMSEFLAWVEDVYENLPMSHAAKVASDYEFLPMSDGAKVAFDALREDQRAPRDDHSYEIKALQNALVKLSKCPQLGSPSGLSLEDGQKWEKAFKYISGIVHHAEIVATNTCPNEVKDLLTEIRKCAYTLQGVGMVEPAQSNAPEQLI